VPIQEQVQHNIQLYRQALREAGYNPAERDVSGVFQMYCGESNDEAHHNGGSYVLNYYKFFGSLDQRSPHTSAAFAHYGGGVSRIFAGISYEDLDKRNLILIGDPENLVARIRWAQEFYGTNYLILEVAQGGMPHKYVMPSLERFAKYVMPHFR
jgi:alkanesulfonate monooxygenase SsuD/methylene tetrahydromethanopterin reductase-like flavin-dependent oxidoreductase (luciferase family)